MQGQSIDPRTREIGDRFYRDGTMADASVLLLATEEFCIRRGVLTPFLCVLEE